MKATALLMSALTVLFSPATQMSAQYPVAPAPAAVPLRAPPDLDQLLASIALYPDPLIAEILPAATLPSQIVLADRYVQQHVDYSVIDQQPWDPSIKALTRYPNVLQFMDQNLAWTTDLGQAFLYQQADVMGSIQRLRGQALALGNLQSTPQQTVISQNGVIEIVPANPQVIYVPVYQPDVVYVERPLPGSVFLSFGLGVAIGAWLNYDVDWHHHDLVVWGPGHERPRDYWYHREARPPVIVNQNVWSPHTRGPISIPDRGDRGWGARQPAPVISRPAPSAPAPRARTGPLIGAESARDTHNFSVRGQQSRQAMGGREGQPGRGGGTPQRGQERGGRR